MPPALSIGSDSNIGGAGSTINFNGGILQVTGTAITNLDSHTVNWGSFNGGIDVNNAANAFTISEAIGGSGGLTKTGSGILVLSGSNSYSGGTTINMGTISFANGAFGAGNITFGGGTLQWATGNSQDVSGNGITLIGPGVAATLDTNGNNVTLAGALCGSGGLTKAGPGTLILTGSNSYSGGTTLAAGAEHRQ